MNYKDVSYTLYVYNSLHFVKPKICQKNLLYMYTNISAQSEIL